MDEDRFNMSVRKFLKVVGVTSQREIESAVRDALRDGYVSGGTRRNLDWVRPHLSSDEDEDELLLLADAQTSGGLLVVGEVPGSPVVGHVAPRGAAVVEVR